MLLCRVIAASAALPVAIAILCLGCEKNQNPGATAPRESTISESCKELTQLLRNLPAKEDAVREAAAEITKQTSRLKAFDAKSGKDEVSRLGLAMGDFRRASLSVRSTADRFTKREKIQPSSPPGELTSIRQMEGFEVVSGPGKDLLDALEGYEATCRSLIKQSLASSE